VITTKADDSYYNSGRGKKENYKGGKKHGKDNYYNYSDKSSSYYNQGGYNTVKSNGNKNYDNYYDNDGADYYKNGYENEYKSGDGNTNYYNNDYNYKKSYKKGGYK